MTPLLIACWRVRSCPVLGSLTCPEDGSITPFCTASARPRLGFAESTKSPLSISSVKLIECPDTGSTICACEALAMPDSSAWAKVIGRPVEGSLMIVFSGSITPSLAASSRDNSLPVSGCLTVPLVASYRPLAAASARPRDVSLTSIMPLGCIGSLSSTSVISVYELSSMPVLLVIVINLSILPSTADSSNCITCFNSGSLVFISDPSNLVILSCSKGWLSGLEGVSFIAMCSRASERGIGSDVPENLTWPVFESTSPASIASSSRIVWPVVGSRKADLSL